MLSKNRKIGIATFATKKYKYAIPNFGRRVCGAIFHSNIKKGTFIFVGDESDIIREHSKKYIADLLPEGWDFVFIPISVNDDDVKNYKEDAQLLICQLQSTAFSYARQIDLDYLWSVESDVLVAPNALSVSLDMLRFDDSYYDVAMCTYPSQGGGSFLGGHGSYERNIEDDFLPEERELPEELKKKYEEHQEKFKDIDEKTASDWYKENAKISEEIKKHPPNDNIFSLNGKNWRRRGWMEYAYPAVGRGAVLPTDWVGLGCTLMSRKALSFAHFDGYVGLGTQDLFITFNWWKPNKIRMCVITHAVCDHVIRKRLDDDKQDFDNVILIKAHHENTGEYRNHLRQTPTKFYNHIPGEKPDESADSL